MVQGLGGFRDDRLLRHEGLGTRVYGLGIRV